MKPEPYFKETKEDIKAIEDRLIDSLVFGYVNVRNHERSLCLKEKKKQVERLKERINRLCKEEAGYTPFFIDEVFKETFTDLYKEDEDG